MHGASGDDDEQRELSGSSTDEIDTVPDTSSPAYTGRHPLTRAFDKFASLVTRWAGSPVAFSMAVCTVATWEVIGPIFHYSDGWQLFINTDTTIVASLMVFLIQQSQNKDSVALHLKLNEPNFTQKAASDKLFGTENASEEASPLGGGILARRKRRRLVGRNFSACYVA